MGDLDYCHENFCQFCVKNFEYEQFSVSLIRTEKQFSESRAQVTQADSSNNMVGMCTINLCKLVDKSIIIFDYVLYELYIYIYFV